MTRKGLKKTILLLLFLMAILWGMEKTFALSPNFDFNIQSHHLLVQIDPSQHFLKAEDQLEINIKWGKPPTLSFLLNPKLKITRIVDQRTGRPLHWYEANFSAHAKRVDVSLHKSAEHLILSISYEGPIYDPVVKEKALQFVRGDQTSGLIGFEGVYLSSSSWCIECCECCRLNTHFLELISQERGHSIFGRLRNSHVIPPPTFPCCCPRKFPFSTLSIVAEKDF